MRYRVINDHTELERNARLYVLPGEVIPGQLAAIECHAGVIVGRWYPGWIIQPERAIALTVPCRILGLVIPADPTTVCLN